VKWKVKQASTKDPAAPGLGIGDTSQSGEASALEPERIKRRSEVEAEKAKACTNEASNIAAANLVEYEPETDDELIGLCWQDLTRDAVSHKVRDNEDDELVEDDATFDQYPQLPGSPSRTEAIAARLVKEAKGRSADDHNEAEQSEAKRMKVARFRRIQSIANRGMQSGTFDKEVRWAANQPPIKVQRGIAGDRIRRGELQAINRIVKQASS